MTLSWSERLEAAALELRRSPSSDALARTVSLLEELTRAARAGVVKEPLLAMIEKLRTELGRAEAVSRQLAAIEAEWARSLWEALGAESGTSYSAAGHESGLPGLRRTAWEG